MPKVLVIDDDDELCKMIHRILENAGLLVVKASDGRAGVDLYRSERPDLVMTDVLMPNKEGLETIRDILAIRPDAKIIAMSGGGRTANMTFLEMAREIGAIAIMEKPFRAKALLATVIEILTAQTTSRAQ